MRRSILGQDRSGARRRPGGSRRDGVVNSFAARHHRYRELKQEMRVGDRLLPEPSRQLQTYIAAHPPSHAPGRIVSIYGSASVLNAGQNQVVALNKGRADGMEPGMVLAILKDGHASSTMTTGTGPNSSCLMGAMGCDGDGVLSRVSCLIANHGRCACRRPAGESPLIPPARDAA